MGIAAKSVRGLLPVTLVVICVACTADPEPGPTPCGSLLNLMKAADLLPTEAGVAGLPVVAIYDDRTIRGHVGVVVDPAPRHRGEHPLARYWLDESSCSPIGGLYGWGPPPPGDPPPPASTIVGTAEIPAGTMDVLVVTGADGGAADDTVAWRTAIAALGARGTALHAPTAATALETLATRCARGAIGRSLLLVTTGLGTPTGGGALILGDEAVSWASIIETLDLHCRNYDLVVWVVDASWAASASATWSPSYPAILWTASDAVQPGAVRMQEAAGGALSHVLAEAVTQRATADCLATAQAPPSAVAAAFSSDEIRERIVAQRFERIGAPLLVDLSVDGSDAEDRKIAPVLASLLDAEVAEDLIHTWGAPPDPDRCDTDEDCAILAVRCGLGACATLVCDAGRCAGAPATGAPCDDGDPCTEEDVCSQAGLCRGGRLPCDDENPCTDDGCLAPFGCVHLNSDLGRGCSDGSECTSEDTCDGQGACIGVEADCDDLEFCTIDGCDPDSGCTNEPLDQPCDDGSVCTEHDFCVLGLCEGQDVDCDDDEPCTTDGCDPETLGCDFVPVADGVLCDDSDGCTKLDHCEAGACVGDENGCDDDLDCTTDSCQQGSCVHLPPPGTCATTQGCIAVGERPADNPCVLCTATDSLQADLDSDGTACAPDAYDCTFDVCDAGECAHPNQPGTCVASDGSCVGVGDPIDECVVCTGAGIAAPADEGAPCDAGDPCMPVASCSAGSCTGARAPCCPIAAMGCDLPAVGETGSGLPAEQNQSWSCIPAQAYPAFERHYSFVAPCDGWYTFTLDAFPGTLAFITRGGEASCNAGDCDNFVFTSQLQNLVAGEELILTIDGQLAGVAPFNLSISCPCPDGG